MRSCADLPGNERFCSLNTLSGLDKMEHKRLIVLTNRALTALTIVSLLSGCVSIRFPVLDSGVAPPPSLQEDPEAHTGTAFMPESLVTQPPIKPEDVSEENERDVYTAARAAADAAQAAADLEPQADSTSLTLQSTRQYALENNLTLRVSTHDPAIAQAGYERELAKFENVFALSTSYGQSFDGTSRARATDTVTLTPSVRVPLRNGATLSLALPISDIENDTLGTDTTSVGADFSVSVPLMRNAGTFFNTASIRQSGLRVRQADARTKLEAIRVLANVERAYWNYYAAHEDLKIQLDQYDLAVEQLRIANRLVEEGVRTKVEVTRAESGVARRFDSVIQAETTRRRTERALKRVMNESSLSVETDTAIVPSTSPAPLGLIFDRRVVAELALNNRMELLDNEIQSAVDEISVGVSRNQVLPDVRFDFNYSFSGAQPTFDRAIEQLTRTELNSYSVGLTAEIPLSGNQAARATLRESILAKSRTEASRRVLEIAIRQEVFDAIDAVEQNWQRILSNKTAVARAGQTYKEEQQQFQLGDVTSKDVLDALTELADARSAEVQSLRDYQNAVVDLAFATGTVLGQGGVIWSPILAEFDELATYEPNWWHPQP